MTTPIAYAATECAAELPRTVRQRVIADLRRKGFAFDAQTRRVETEQSAEARQRRLA